MESLKFMETIELRNNITEIVEHADNKLLKMIYGMAIEYQKDDDEESQLYRLVYTSARSEDCTEADIAQILEASRKNNAKIGLTGILIYTQDRFLQVLEGPKENVMKLYNRLKKDKRHGGSTMRYCEPVEERHFGDWNMASKKLDQADVDYKTDIPEDRKVAYQSMLNGDVRSYKDDGMRVLKSFLQYS